MEPKFTSHIKKGLLIAALLIIINVIGQLTHLVYRDAYGLGAIAIFIISIIIATLYFGKQKNNNITFSLLLTHGFKTAVVAICIVFIYTYISLHLLFPQYTDHLLQLLTDEAKKQGKTSAEIEQGIKSARTILINTRLAGSLMINLISGAIGSLIGSVAANKNINHTVPLEQ